MARAITAPKRKAAELVMVELPMPPSVNRLKMSGFRSSPQYKAWKKAAGWELETQRPAGVSGPYTLRLIVSRAGTRMDLGNVEKAVSDLLQAHGVIDNDNLCEALHVTWGDDLTGVRTIVVATHRDHEEAFYQSLRSLAGLPAEAAE